MRFDADMVVTLNRAAVTRLASRAGEDATRKAAARTVERMQNILISGGHVVTGKLVTSMRVYPERTGKMTSVLAGSLLHYARIVNDGRGPVFPKRAKVLRFKPKGRGAFVFAKSVGPAKPVRYIERALTQFRASDFR